MKILAWWVEYDSFYFRDKWNSLLIWLHLRPGPYPMSSETRKALEKAMTDILVPGIKETLERKYPATCEPFFRGNSDANNS